MVNFSSSTEHQPRCQEGMQYNNVEYYSKDTEEDEKKTSSTITPTNTEPNQHQHYGGDTTTNKLISYQLVWRCFCVHMWFGFLFIGCFSMHEIITDPYFQTSPLFSGLHVGLLVCIVLVVLFAWLYIGCVYLLIMGTTMSWSFGSMIYYRCHERLIAQHLFHVAGHKETLLPQYHPSNDATTATTHGVSSSGNSLTNKSQEETQKVYRSHRICTGVFMMLVAIHSTYSTIQGTVLAIEAISQSFDLYNCVRLYVMIGFNVLVLWFLGIVGYNLYIDIFVTAVTTPTTSITNWSEINHQQENSESVLVTKIDTSA